MGERPHPTPYHKSPTPRTINPLPPTINPLPPRGRVRVGAGGAAAPRREPALERRAVQRPRVDLPQQQPPIVRAA